MRKANMVFTPKVLHAAKCGFLILLIVSVSVFTSLLYIAEKDDGSTGKVDEFPYSKPEFQFSQDMLDDNFDACLFAPFQFRENANNRSESFANLTRYDYLQLTKAEKAKWFPLADLLIESGTLMLSYMRIETVLMEPSILFCMLSPSHKGLLIKRKFDIRPYVHPHKVVTLGIRGEDAALLRRDNVQQTIRSFGFDVEFLNEPVPDWMKSESSLANESVSSHIFLRRGDWTIHLVVLHKRGHFLWHAAVKPRSSLNIPRVLFFAETESAYDNFTFVSLGIWGEPLNFIYIPSNPQYFLFEMETSKFIDCNSTIVSSFLMSQGTKAPGTHSSLSQKSFNRRTIVALQELKALFAPFLMHFWIWSGTMLGWHRQCDIIPYTTDVDFGAWASEVEDLPSLLKIFNNNKHICLKQLMGMPEVGLEFYLSCHSLRVDIFFLYEENNGTWYAGHRPSKGYYFKYHHPNFTVCSAALLEHKVLVPCETEAVIAAEYGSEWMHPVSSWNYESSIKNRGSNIYWNKSLLKKVYPEIV